VAAGRDRHRRRCRSFNSGAIDLNRSPIRASSTTPPKFYIDTTKPAELFFYEPLAKNESSHQAVVTRVGAEGQPVPVTACMATPGAISTTRSSGSATRA
jgi:hypothetical protein